MTGLFWKFFERGYTPDSVGLLTHFNGFCTVSPGLIRGRVTRKVARFQFTNTAFAIANTTHLFINTAFTIAVSKRTKTNTAFAIANTTLMKTNTTFAMTNH
ncbi:hypothetical protein ACKFKF_25645 [Phormidesmis sp. 146-12]